MCDNEHNMNTMKIFSCTAETKLNTLMRELIKYYYSSSYECSQLMAFLKLRNRACVVWKDAGSNSASTCLFLSVPLMYQLAPSFCQSYYIVAQENGQEDKQNTASKASHPQLYAMQTQISQYIYIYIRIGLMQHTNTGK